jgi:seryl-tRNA synthetase
MLSLSYIRENREEVVRRLKIKNFKGVELVDNIIALDAERRGIQKELDENLSRANNISKEIGALYKEGRRDEAENLKAETASLNEKSRILKEKLQDAEKEQNDLLIMLPNLPHASVKSGISSEDNEKVFISNNLAGFENLKGLTPHWDLAKKYDLIDFELGNKITGAGFPVYKGKGAKLQRALISFFLDEAGKQGYTEFEPPIMINEASGYGTGQLPDKEGQMYYVEKDGLYLIPTAEVPLTNLYRDVILKEDELPVMLTGYTPCFRREAGSYGKDVRGLNRLHQFDKVEIVQIAHPDKSYDILETMKSYVAGLIEKLGLPYRILKLCGGDMSFTSALTYDMEVYSAGQEKWLEVSSVSNFENFQANRAKIRFKDKEGRTTLAHTLNGSALALPRIVAAILENNQDENGIRIPEVLVSYCGFDRIG